MGLFAFRRRQEREAASQEAASFPIAEPAPKLELTSAPTDGSNNRRNGRGRKRQQLPDTGSSADAD